MLIQFSVGNFLSFDAPVYFDMRKGHQKLQTHPSHLVRAKDIRTGDHLLRAAFIFGPNASGKSNLIKAMAFAKNIAAQIRGESENIDLSVFKLRSDAYEQPSQFEFDFRFKGHTYNYGFVIVEQTITEEWLYRAYKQKDDEIIFFRKTEFSEGQARNLFQWHEQFAKTLVDEQRTLEDQLNWIGLSTRPNQSFLAEAIDNNARNITGLEHLVRAFDWFDKALMIIYPHSKPDVRILELNLDQIRELLKTLLKDADTGIEDIELKTASLQHAGFPEEFKSFFLSRMREGDVALAETPEGARALICKENGELLAKKLILFHKNDRGKLVPFDLHEESDGTRRLIELAPAFYDFSSGTQEKVLVIDELDRSLHPHLSELLLNFHLTGNAAGRETQLIVTTHETYLLDLKKLRRDELWITQKNEQGATEIYSFDEFDEPPRFDKVLAIDYHLGRFGGVPKIGVRHEILRAG